MESNESELLLQEFSSLTKLLGEAVKDRDQAVVDRDLAVQQKLAAACQQSDVG